MPSRVRTAHQAPLPARSRGGSLHRGGSARPSNRRRPACRGAAPNRVHDLLGHMPEGDDGDVEEPFRYELLEFVTEERVNWNTAPAKWRGAPIEVVEVLRCHRHRPPSLEQKVDEMEEPLRRAIDDVAHHVVRTDKCSSLHAPSVTPPSARMRDAERSRVSHVTLAQRVSRTHDVPANNAASGIPSRQTECRSLLSPKPYA